MRYTYKQESNEMNIKILNYSEANRILFQILNFHKRKTRLIDMNKVNEETNCTGFAFVKTERPIWIVCFANESRFG